MANTVETIFTARTDQWEAGCRKVADTLKATSGRMLDDMRQAGDALANVGRAAGSAANDVQGSAGSYSRLDDAIRKVAQAQSQATVEFRAAKAAYKDGTIGLEEYRRQQLETRTALGLVRAEYNQSVADLKRGAGQMVGSSNMARFGIQNLGFQVQDLAVQIGGGTSAIRAFSQQGPQMIGAIQAMSGGTSKFAQFMGGPWGAALGAGVAIVGALATKLFDSSDAADTAKRGQESLAQQLDLTKHSFDEVIAATREYNAQQVKSQTLTLDTARAVAAQAAANIRAALAIREKLAADLASYQQSSLMPTGPNGQGQIGAAVGAQAIAAQIKANEDALKALTTGAWNAVNDVGGEIAKIASDPRYAIEQKFERLRDAAKASHLPVDQLAKKLADLNRQQKAAEDALNKSSRAGGAGSANALGGMTALLRSMGFIVAHTTDGKHVKGSEHYTGNAIDFVPKGGMGQYSKAQVEQMLTEAGVQFSYGTKGVKQFFGPGDKGHANHFHVGFTGSPNPDRAQDIAQREADKAVRRAKDFADQSANLDDQLLQAKRANLTDAEDIATAARQQVRIELDKTNATIDAKVALKDYSEAQGKQLHEKAAQVAAEKLITVETEEVRRQATQALAIWSAANDNQLDFLHIQEQLALTQADRRRVQLAILAAEKEEERRKLSALASDARAKPEERLSAQLQLGALDAKYAAKGTDVVRQTQGPLERYLTGLKSTPGQINERIEDLVVNELESVRHGINDAIGKTLGIKDPLLSGLIDMMVESLFIKPLAETLRRASTGGVGGGVSSLIGSALSIFGIGKTKANLAGSQAGFTTAFEQGFASLNNPFSHYALGTTGARAGYALVGEEGPEIVKFRGGEQVVPNGQISVGRGGGNHYYFHGNMMTEEFWAAIQAGDDMAMRGGASLSHMQSARSTQWSLAA